MNQSFLDTELEAVRSILIDAADISDQRVRSILIPFVSSGGKFLRPKILLLSAMTGKYPKKAARSAAAAIELLHLASLIHDDVIDSAPLRRGKPTIYDELGSKQAVLAGDYLLSRCVALAAAHTRVKNASRIAGAVSVMVSSELAQDSAKWKFSSSIRSCVRLMSGKTAILFSLAAVAGAREAQCPLAVISALGRAAWSIGIAFQIEDDILDWTGQECETGKPVLGDLKAGLCTLPLVFALKEKGSLLMPLLSNDAISKGSSADIIEIVRSTSAIEKTLLFAQKYYQRAFRELEKIPPSFARDELCALFESCKDRRR